MLVMHEVRPPQLDEVAPDLPDVIAAVELLWVSASTARPDNYPGFVVTHDGACATFRMYKSPTIYDSVALSRGEDGTWCVEKQTQRPTMEDQGFGQLVRTTTTQRLTRGAKATKLIEQTRPDTEGQFAPQSFGVCAGEGLGEQGYQSYLDLFRSVRGEREHPHARSPHQGWMQWIFGIPRQ